MNIRYANEKDSTLLAELGRKTFYDTFSEQNTPEDMSLYLAEHYLPELQLAEIKDPHTLFLIAEIQGIPVGYAKLKSQSQTDGLSGSTPIELQRIYIEKQYIGNGIGAQLMNEAIREARQQGFNSLWLGVWEKNKRAIIFYNKCGFKIIGSQTFKLGTDLQNDLTMELMLN